VSRCVVDTNIASLLLYPDARLTPYLPHLAVSSPVLSFQTVAELRFGALKAGWGVRRQQELELFIGQYELVPYSDELAWHWAEVMRDAANAGRRLDAGDAWIAATAKRLSAPLLTRDKEFDSRACPAITIINYEP
jgi:predicted nucleic acid-binding protein